MPLTPVNIRSQVFSQRMRGIDADEVASFLGRVAEELEIALDANVKLEEQLEAFQAEINDYQAKEKEFSTAILSAYKTSTDMKTKSEEEAKTLLANAKQEAKTLQESLTKEARALKESAAQEAKALKESSSKEASQLRQATQQESNTILEKTKQEMAELRATVTREVAAIRQEAKQKTDALAAMTMAEIDEERTAGLKETQALIDQSKLEIFNLRQQTELEKKRIEGEISELKSLRTTVQNQMREMLRSYLERLEAVGKELGEEPPPPPPVKKPAPPAPKPVAPKADLDDLTASTGSQSAAAGKNFTAMDVDDLTGLYEKIDISDLGAPGGLLGDGLESLAPGGNHDLSLDDPFEDLAPAAPRGGPKKK